MKKVNDIPDFLSNIQNQKPSEPLLNSIQSLAAEENFMKKLLEASIVLQNTEMSDGDSGDSGEVTRDNSGDRFPPVILVTGETLLSAPAAPPPPPPVAQFFPSKAENDLQFLPISNPEISSKTKAIFPENPKGDDEIVFITQRPQVNELNNLRGFQQIPSPSLGQRDHLVTSQLVVGEEISQTSERPVLPAERQKAEEQLEQLEELGKTANISDISHFN